MFIYLAGLLKIPLFFLGIDCSGNGCRGLERRLGGGNGESHQLGPQNAALDPMVPELSDKSVPTRLEEILCGGTIDIYRYRQFAYECMYGYISLFQRLVIPNSRYSES